MTVGKPICGSDESSGSDQRKRIPVVLAAAILVHLTFWISLGTGWLDPLFNDSMHRNGKGVDFFQFYQGGANLLRGLSIYQYTDSDRVPYGPPNKYPPLLIASVGLAAQALRPWTAYAVWVGLIGAAFAALMLVIRALIPPDARTPVLCLSLVFSPFYVDLHHGQTNTFMALILALILLGLASARGRLSGMAMAAGANLKMNTLLLAPVFIRQGYWRALLGSLVLGAALFFPYFFFFPDDLGFFFRYAFGAPGRYFYQGGNLGPYPLLQEIGHLFTYRTGPIVRMQTLWSAMVLLVTLAIHWKARRREPVNLAVLWVIAFCLAYKFVWEHHLVFLLPALALAYAHGNRRMVGALWLWLALPTPFVFMDFDLGPGYTEVQPYWTEGQSVLYHSWKLIPILVLYAMEAGRLLGRPLRLRWVSAVLLPVVLAAATFYSLRPPSPKDSIAQAFRSWTAGDYVAAEDRFRAGIAAAPQYVDGYLFFAHFMRQHGFVSQSYEILKQARAADPEDEAFR